MKKLLILLLFAFSSIASFSQADTMDLVYSNVEQAAEFPGGVAALDKFVAKNLKIPKDTNGKKMNGLIRVLFVVRKDGSVTNVTTDTKGLLENEAKRVISLMPNWEPAKRNGVAVSTARGHKIQFGKPEKLPKKKSLVVFKIVEHMPEFPGGESQLYAFIEKNIKYPKMALDSNISQKVRVKFVVKKDGSLSDFEVPKPVGYGLDEEAIRIVKKMPKWLPGKNNGVAVNTWYQIPIDFKSSKK